VRSTLTAHRDKLDALATLLREKEVVDRATLDALLSAAAPGETSLRKVAFVAASRNTRCAELTCWRNQMHRLWTILAATLVLSLAGCGYNTLQVNDEQIKASWSEVVNQYQRRADLVPNLVNTVKGYAAQEKEVLTRVTEARSRVGSIQATPELINDHEAFAKFQAAQGELSGALSMLLVVSENYPQLKSDANFRDLQSQLEGAENQITVARNRYIQAVQAYNVTARSFPSNLTATVFGYSMKANFTVDNKKEIAKAPKVDFASPLAKPQAEAQGATK